MSFTPSQKPRRRLHSRLQIRRRDVPDMSQPQDSQLRKRLPSKPRLRLAVMVTLFTNLSDTQTSLVPRLLNSIQINLTGKGSPLKTRSWLPNTTKCSSMPDKSRSHNNHLVMDLKGLKLKERIVSLTMMRARTEETKKKALTVSLKTVV